MFREEIGAPINVELKCWPLFTCACACINWWIWMKMLSFVWFIIESEIISIGVMVRWTLVIRQSGRILVCQSPNLLFRLSLDKLVGIEFVHRVIRSCHVKWLDWWWIGWNLHKNQPIEISDEKCQTIKLMFVIRDVWKS